jgi:hypothetical protein
VARGRHAALNQRLLRLKEREADMRGAENDESEMSFRRGYEQGVIDVFYAIERFLDPVTREALQAWIEKDVSIWRVEGVLLHPPNWRLKMLAGPRSAGRPLDSLDLRYTGWEPEGLLKV